LTLPLIIRWVHPPELFPRLPEAKQEAKINRQLHEAALQELNQHYTIQSDENDLLIHLKTRLENGLQLNKIVYADRDGPVLARYNEALAKMHQVKRRELEKLRHQEEFDEDIIRKIEAQLDLEEEKTDHSVR
jgi:hypothetical protein